MPKITFLPHDTICPDGAVIEVESDETILNVALANKLAIEHACEKSCACTTCHVIVREGFNSLEDAEENEEDYLDKAWGSGAGISAKLSGKSRHERPRYRNTQIHD